MGEKRPPRIRPTFRVSRIGLAQVLGDLEMAIMETLWRLGTPATVTEVQRAMTDVERAYHTVTTVMVRLCEKGLLRRRKRQGVWHYVPRLGRDEFHSQVTQEVIAGAYALAPGSAVTSMLDLVEASDPGGLDALAELIERKKRERGGG